MEAITCAAGLSLLAQVFMRRRDTATAVVCLLWVRIRVRRGALALKRKKLPQQQEQAKKSYTKNDLEKSARATQGSFATRTHGLRFSKGDCSLKWRPPRPDARRRICVAAMGMPRPCCTGSREISVQVDCAYYEILAKNAYLARKAFEESNSTTRKSGTSFIQPHPKLRSIPYVVNILARSCAILRVIKGGKNISLYVVGGMA